MMRNILKKTRNMALLAMDKGKMPTKVVAAPSMTEGPISPMVAAIRTLLDTLVSCRAVSTNAPYAISGRGEFVANLLQRGRWHRHAAAQPAVRKTIAFHKVSGRYGTQQSTGQKSQCFLCGLLCGRRCSQCRPRSRCDAHQN